MPTDHRCAERLAAPRRAVAACSAERAVAGSAASPFPTRRLVGLARRPRRRQLAAARDRRSTPSRTAPPRRRAGRGARGSGTTPTSRSRGADSRRRPAQRGPPRRRRCARWPRSAAQDDRTGCAPTAASTARCSRSSTATDPAGLDATAARLRAHVLRDFRRSGRRPADDATRARLREISERLTVPRPGLRPPSSATTSASIRIAPEQLAGLPEDFVAAHPADADGLVTDHHRLPRLHPVPHVRPRRRRPPRARASSSSTAAGRPTTPCCTRCSTCATSRPACSATPSWPDYDAEVKMIGSGDGHRRVHRADRRRRRRRRPAATTAVLLERQRQRRARRDRLRRVALRLLRGAGPARAVRRRRPGGPALLRLRPGARAACSTSPAGCSGSSTAPVDATGVARGRHRLRRVRRRRG